MHLQFKLRRWEIEILMSVPESKVGGWMHMERTLCQRHPPGLGQAYAWEFFSSDRIRGVGDLTLTEQPSVVLLDQESDGLHWSIAGDNIGDPRTADACQTLLRHQIARDIVFYTHLLLYGLPWNVPGYAANKHVQQALKTQPFR
uniref:Uncharacterized protein n=1 Tax=Peronospora matthiolae TaxID=2874970 RepID=A0AAV1UY68_9STRA